MAPACRQMATDSAGFEPVGAGVQLLTPKGHRKSLIPKDFPKLAQGLPYLRHASPFFCETAPRCPGFRRWAAVTAGLLAGMAAAQAQTFDFESLTRMARERAATAYQPASDKLPPDLARLNYDQVRDIRWRPDRALWRAENLPFEAMFFHLGLYRPSPC